MRTFEREVKLNRGGHPPTPRTAAEVRVRISCEVSQRGREAKLRQWYRLLRSFTDAEKAERENARTAAIVEQNRLKQQQLEFRKAEYRRRFAATEHGRQALLRMVERLQAENAALKANAPAPGTTVESVAA